VGDLEGMRRGAENHRLSLDPAGRIASEVWQSLEHAQSYGIIHRDLKPGNICLTRDGTAKLGDFGLAVAVDRCRLTVEGMDDGGHRGLHGAGAGVRTPARRPQRPLDHPG